MPSRLSPPPPEPAGAWSIDALTGRAVLAVSAPGEDVLVVYRLSIGGRSVTWRDAWVSADESLERALHVPPAAVVHEAMLSHTLILHTRLERAGGRDTLEPLGVRLSRDPGSGAILVTALPTIADEAPSDPDLARNIVHRVIRYDRDLMDRAAHTVLEPSAIDLGGAP